MHIHERSVGDVVVLDLHGRMIVGDGDGAITQAIAGVAARGTRKIVLNFADVPYMDTVGLSTLVHARLRMNQNEGRLALLHVPARIAGLLRITKLLEVFETFDSESVAVESLAQALPAARLSRPSTQS